MQRKKQKWVSGITMAVITAVLTCLPVSVAYAHGLVYETSKSVKDKNTMLVTLKWSDPAEAKGIVITKKPVIKNGKTLTVEYDVKEGAPTTASVEYNLLNVIPPIRVNIMKAADPAWAPFDDIKGSEVREHITHLHDAGIVNGRDGNNFRPEATITRAEFMALMVRALKLEPASDSQNKYSDIGNHWAKNIILTASNNRLISGYTDGTIRPDNPITVAEVSTVISKAFTFKTVRNGLYTKLKPNMWYSGYVKKMFDVGILSPSDSIYKEFDEQKPINRGNCAAMISRALSTY